MNISLYKCGNLKSVGLYCEMFKSCCGLYCEIPHCWALLWDVQILLWALLWDVQILLWALLWDPTLVGYTMNLGGIENKSFLIQVWRQTWNLLGLENESFLIQVWRQTWKLLGLENESFLIQVWKLEICWALLAHVQILLWALLWDVQILLWALLWDPTLVGYTMNLGGIENKSFLIQVWRQTWNLLGFACTRSNLVAMTLWWLFSFIVDLLVLLAQFKSCCDDFLALL